MKVVEAYVGLGGNIGDAFAEQQKALQHLKESSCIDQLAVSNFYLTTPVESDSSTPFVNAVCKFKTTATPYALLQLLQTIQKNLGQGPKSRSEDRLIDLDLLFFGNEIVQTPELQIPHPRWKERLFVLVPLAELTDKILLLHEQIILKDILNNFSNPHNETVLLQARS